MHGLYEWMIGKAAVLFKLVHDIENPSKEITTFLPNVQVHMLFLLTHFATLMSSVSTAYIYLLPAMYDGLNSPIETLAFDAISAQIQEITKLEGRLERWVLVLKQYRQNLRDMRVNSVQHGVATIVTPNNKNPFQTPVDVGVVTGQPNWITKPGRYAYHLVDTFPTCLAHLQDQGSYFPSDGKKCGEAYKRAVTQHVENFLEQTMDPVISNLTLAAKQWRETSYWKYGTMVKAWQTCNSIDDNPDLFYPTRRSPDDANTYCGLDQVPCNTYVSEMGLTQKGLCRMASNIVSLKDATCTAETTLSMDECLANHTDAQQTIPCPAWAPYASWVNGLCYNNSEFAKKGVGPCGSWCSQLKGNADVAVGCGKMCPKRTRSRNPARRGFLFVS